VLIAVLVVVSSAALLSGAGLAVLGPTGLAGVIAAAAYVWWVVVPLRREDRRIHAAEASFTSLRDEAMVALKALRSGDLVAAAEERPGMPETIATTAVSAARSLAALMRQIQDSSVEVAFAAGEVHATVSELASGSSEQAAAVMEITSTTEELARTAAQIASNASGQADLAVHAEAAGETGMQAVEAALGGVEEVRGRIEDIAERADTIDTKAKEIYSILDLINEISHETHILALNAAIEASAAGEHGRRFSVVADEVRRLSQRSRESVDSVRSLLEEFSGSIRGAVVATEEGGKEVEQVLAQARSAAAAIDQLRGALSDTAQTAKEISLATQEQQTASDQVVMTLKEVSEVVQQVADGLKQFSGAADRLIHLALSIQLLTQSFHLDSPRSLQRIVRSLAAQLADCDESWEATDELLRQFVNDNGYVELAYVVDHEGAMVAFAVNEERIVEHDASGVLQVGRRFADRPWFQAVARKGRTVVSPVYESAFTQEQCFTVASPVLRIDGAMAGVLGLDVNLTGWTKI
jgi:methyl-accepting chemotaxis protein